MWGYRGLMMGPYQLNSSLHIVVVYPIYSSIIYNTQQYFRSITTKPNILPNPTGGQNQLYQKQNTPQPQKPLLLTFHHHHPPYSPFHIRNVSKSPSIAHIKNSPHAQTVPDNPPPPDLHGTSTPIHSQPEPVLVDLPNHPSLTQSCKVDQPHPYIP